MKIEELKAKLDIIPKKGALNIARRHKIQKEIYALLKKGENK